jgi:enamine deaminase RidA (YjgF/YER057c/UK114 family)
MVSEGLPYTSGHPVKMQAREVFRRLQATLAAAGSDLDHTVLMNQWQPTFLGEGRDTGTGHPSYDSAWEGWRYVTHAYIQARDEFLLENRPASVLVPVDRLVGAESYIEVQAISLLSGSGTERRSFTHEVHNAKGGYSLGVEAGPWLFTAGLIATDYETGLHPGARISEHIWYGNQIAAEVDELLRQLQVIVEAGGSNWNNVVHSALCLTPLGMRNMPAVDEVWTRYWPDDPPARAVIPIDGTGLKGGNVEIRLVAARPGDGGERQVIQAPGALPALGHSAQAVRSGHLLFLSSQLGRTPDGPSGSAMAMKRGMPFARRHIVEQARRIQDDVQSICEAAGTSIDNVVKADVFLSDFTDLATFLDEWGKGFSHGYPASGFFETTARGHVIPDCDVSADLIAFVPSPS